MSHNTAYIADSNLIYILVKSREEFDKIALPLNDDGPKEGRGYVITKAIHDVRSTEPGRPLSVIFQFWVVNPPLFGTAKQAT